VKINKFKHVKKKIKGIKVKKFIGYTVAIILTFAASYFIFNNTEDVNNIGYKSDVFWSSNNKNAHMLLNRALSRESHISWSTGNHTASPVPCGAIGAEKYTNQLKGIIDNTDIGKVTRQAVKDGVNVILVIGDGMGFNHMSLPIYMRIAEGEKEKTYFEKIMDEGSCGIVFNNPLNGIVTGSATSATALATGYKNVLDIVSIDTNGYPIETNLELAEKLNYVTGLVTDAGITDGTPAAFYAHSYNRNLENQIAEQLSSKNIEVIFGGGAKLFIPKGTELKDFSYFKNTLSTNEASSERNDDINVLSKFEEKGYEIISNKNDLLNLNKKTDKVLGLFNAGGMSAAIDRDFENTGEPSLIEMTEKALEILDDKNKNIFLMVEAGRIDWEAHDNDAGAVYKAVEEMNGMLKVCYDYQKSHKNTLLIFTADHETGGLGISYTKVSKDKLFKKKLESGDVWESNTDPLFFDEFKKLKNQKRAFYRIFGEAQTIDELYKMLQDNTDYKLTYQDAEIIFNTLRGYEKGK